MTIRDDLGSATDPFKGYTFKVSIRDLDVAAFKQCTGLDSATSASQYREGGDASLTQVEVSGLTTYTNLSLRDGIASKTDLWQWREQVTNGTITRQDLTITRDDGPTKRSWTIKNAWPSQWSGPSFDATAVTTKIQQLELAHEGIEQAS